MTEYQLPEKYNCTVRFETNVLEHFSKHKQLQKKDHEAGGQLFAEITESLITVKVSTGPHPEDKRWRFMFSPSVKVEQEEIRKYFENEKLHYIGDWHTHPEQSPSPSGADIKAIKKTYTENNNGIFGILMVIVGTHESPKSLFVALQTESGLDELSVLK